MRSLALLVAGLVLIAGCLGVGSDAGPEQGEPREALASSAVETAGGLPSLNLDGEGASQARPTFAPAVNVSTEVPGSEPMVDVGPEGTIYLTGIGFTDLELPDPLATAPNPQNGVWRSTDGGATWVEVTPELPGGGEGSFDNVLAVGGDGTVYYGTALGEVFAMYRSTDRGQSWTPIPSPRLPAAAHRAWLVAEGESTVHLALTGTPPVNDVWYHRSTDQGATWTRTGLARAQGNLATDLGVGPDGTLYVASVEDGSPVGAPPGLTLHRSTDGGLRWTSQRIVSFEGPYTSAWASLEVGPRGTVFIAWAEGEDGASQIHYTYSQDRGQTWSTAKPAVPSQTTQALPWMDVRDPGELGFAYYAANASVLPDEASMDWFPIYAFVANATSEDPDAYRTRLTDWPVHEGIVCNEGAGSCSPYNGSALLDFTWIEFGPEGEAHVGVASSRWEHRMGFPIYAGEASAFQPPAS